MGDDGVGVAVAHLVGILQERDDLHVRQVKLVLDLVEPMRHRLTVGLFDRGEVSGAISGGHGAIVLV